MPKREYYDFRVIGGKDEVRSFLRLMTFLNSCALSGHSAEVKVSIDGDGSGGSLKIVDIEDESQMPLLPERSDMNTFMDDCEKHGIEIGRASCRERV